MLLLPMDPGFHKQQMEKKTSVKKEWFLKFSKSKVALCNIGHLKNNAQIDKKSAIESWNAMCPVAGSFNRFYEYYIFAQ